MTAHLPLSAALCALLAASALPASAQDAPAADDRVVVEGRSIRDAAVDFVGQVADPVSRNFGIARWSARICVGVQDAPPDAAQYLADRVSGVALELGLRIGEPGCAPNVSIMFTDDGAGLAAFLTEREPRAFRPWGGTGGTTQGLAALRAFAESDAPVRWWHVSMTVDRIGLRAIDIPNEDPPTNHDIGASRIHNPLRDELQSALIIVDIDALHGLSWAQIGDYLAMVALAQVDPAADTSGHDTILNLFAGPAAPPELTEWDFTYLRALYRFDQHRAPQMQAGGVVSEMLQLQRQAQAAGGASAPD